MNKIWLTSDTHFNHDKEFIWGSRGYSNVQEMNKDFVVKWNALVNKNDDIYHLGDFFLGDLDAGLKIIAHLHGNIHLCIGNHDTDDRIREIAKCPNIVDVQMGYRRKFEHKSFLLTHYPTETGGKSIVYNLYGHTHQKDNFYEKNFWMYHVGVDSHDGYPVELSIVKKQILTYQSVWHKEG